MHVRIATAVCCVRESGAVSCTGVCERSPRRGRKDLTEPDERASLSSRKAIKDVVDGQKVFVLFFLRAVSL